MCIRDREYTLHISGSPLEGEPEDNLVVKAYKLLKKDYPGLLPVDIDVYKRQKRMGVTVIPI